MKQIAQLLTSPFAVFRILITVLSTLLALQSGEWFDNSLFGAIAIVYASAYGLALLSKLGGDSAFSRSQSDVELRSELLKCYILTCIKRLIVISAILTPLLYFEFEYSMELWSSTVLLSATILIGNALRISQSPNFQIGCDNSSVTVFAIIFSVALGAPVWLACLTLSACMIAWQTYNLARIGSLTTHLTRVTNYRSIYYLASEGSYFTLGFAMPSLVSLFADLNTVGEIRSVERVAFAGTFVLFIVNNRLFHDLPRLSSDTIEIGSYIQKYSIPSAIFFLAVFSVVFLMAGAGYAPNIESQMAIFLCYGFAYLVSTACGPVSGALNYLGDEKSVFLSSMVGAVIMVLSIIIAYDQQGYLPILIGNSVGLIIVNLLQFLRLITR